MKRLLPVPMCFLSLLCLFMLPSHGVQSQESALSTRGYSQERGRWNYCVRAYHMAMKTDGLIRIYFKFDKGYDNCRTFEVSNVVTSPPNGIRGTYGFVKGTNKVPQGKPFALDVTPTTTHVTLLIPYQGDGRITNSLFNFEKTMKNLVLAGKSTNWRQAFQKTESRLAAKAKTDKTPP